MSEMSLSRSSASSGPKSADTALAAGCSAAAPFGATVMCAASRNAIAIELSVKGPAREAEQPCRFDTLPARGLQRAEDLLALRGLERQLGQTLPVGGALDVRLEQMRRQVLGQQHTALADHHRSFEDVGELPHVAGPGVAAQDVEDVRRDAAHRAAELLVERSDEVARERVDVVGAAAQRRQVNGPDVQAIVEVVAERPLTHHLGEVAVGGGDHPDVDPNGIGAADALDLAVLEHAEQLHLDAERQLADLVEEAGAAVRRLEQPLAVAVGAGEGAAHVAEELALEERRCERGAVADDERPVAERREPVERARHELLARAALAGHERGGGVAGEALDEGEHLEHALRARDDPFERHAALQALFEAPRAVRVV